MLDYQKTIVQCEKHQIVGHGCGLRKGEVQLHVVVEDVQSRFNHVGFQ